MATIVPMPIPEKIIDQGEVDIEFKVISMKFGDGYEQIAPDGINNIVEERKVEWAPLTLTEANSVWDIIRTIGAHGLYTWTPCDSTIQKKYRLSDTKVSKTKIGNNYKISIRVREAFDLA